MYTSIMARKKIPAAPAIRRLPSYLQIARQAEADGLEYLSGTVISTELNYEPIQVRKDLSMTGIVGRPRRGYPVKPLVKSIEHFLGWDNPKNVVLIGAGNLGTALTGYQEFAVHGLNFVAAFDTNPDRIGKYIHGVPVLSLNSFEENVKNLGATLAVLTVPSSQAQQVADLIVKSGINAIWNFTNTKIDVPAHVAVQKEDLTSGYAMLCAALQLS